MTKRVTNLSLVVQRIEHCLQRQHFLFNEGAVFVTLLCGGMKKTGINARVGACAFF